MSAGTLCLASLLGYLGLSAPATPGFDPILLPAVTFVITCIGGAMFCLALYFLRSSSVDILGLTADYLDLTDRVNSTAIAPRWQWLLLLVMAGIYYGALISAEFSMFPERDGPPINRATTDVTFGRL